ncbi:MAG: zinc-binding dehydrogenase [Nitrospira sp.]|nr:zinc-binding dehydrogenase [Nitrospira sp.]
MKTKAAVLVELGAPLVIAELEIPPLKPGQVLVEILVSGVCHTQLLECRGERGEDSYLPHCLGHEAVGVVRETGASVSKVKENDTVILSWMKGAGLDGVGTQYRWGSRAVNAGGITTFSRFSVVSENRLVLMRAGVSLDDAAVLGCALATGFGAVFNVAKPVPGQSAVVFGVGRIGLAAVVGAVVAGCTPVIAVDVNEGKLKIAERLGATHTVRSEQSLEQIFRVCPKGVDFAIEASGHPSIMTSAVRSARSQGGTAIVVGNARHGEVMHLDPKELNQGKRLLGTWGGNNDPDRDFERYCHLLNSGKISLAPVTPRHYRLEQVNDALADLENGNAVRPLLVCSDRAGQW